MIALRAVRALRVLVPVVAVAAGNGTAASEPLRIVAATNDLAAIARAVTGPDARIDVVARPDRDPHALEVRPSTMRLAAKSRLYLKVGLSLDLWSDDIVRGSRNRDLEVVDCSRAIAPLEVPTGRVDASQGDVHPEGNPHYWLDPRNGAAVAAFLVERFAALEPDRRDEFAANAAAFAREIDARIPAWRERLRGREFVEVHRTWTYLVERFGMEVVARVEPLPGIPPSARHLAEVADAIRSRGVPVIVRDRYHSAAPLEFLQRETGAAIAVLASSSAEPTPDAYLALFDRAADVLGASPATAAARGTGAGEAR